MNFKVCMVQVLENYKECKVVVIANANMELDFLMCKGYVLMGLMNF